MSFDPNDLTAKKRKRDEGGPAPSVATAVGSSAVRGGQVLPPADLFLTSRSAFGQKRELAERILNLCRGIEEMKLAIILSEKELRALEGHSSEARAMISASRGFFRRERPEQRKPGLVKPPKQESKVGESLSLGSSGSPPGGKEEKKEEEKKQTKSSKRKLKNKEKALKKAAEKLAIPIPPPAVQDAEVEKKEDEKPP